MSTFCEFISTPEALIPACRKYENAHAYPIGQGFALIPVTEDLLRELADLYGDDPCESLPDLDIPFDTALAEIAKEVSRIAPVAYIAGDYWINQGWQAAIVWSMGEVVLGPLSLGWKDDMPAPKGDPQGPVNQALRFIGVTADPGRDEFVSVDIDREPEDWFYRGIQPLDGIEK